MRFSSRNSSIDFSLAPLPAGAVALAVAIGAAAAGVAATAAQRRIRQTFNRLACKSGRLISFVTGLAVLGRSNLQDLKSEMPIERRPRGGCLCVNQSMRDERIRRPPIKQCRCTTNAMQRHYALDAGRSRGRGKEIKSGRVPARRATEQTASGRWRSGSQYCFDCG